MISLFSRISLFALDLYGASMAAVATWRFICLPFCWKQPLTNLASRFIFYLSSSRLFPLNDKHLRIAGVLSLVFLILFFKDVALAACPSIADQKETSAMKPSEEVIDLPADARLVTDLQNGTVRLLKGNKLSEPLLNNEVFRDAVACGSAGKIAILFINAYRKLFRLCHPERELIIATTQTDTLGLTHVRLAQYYKGFRVQPADLNVHLDKQGHVYLVQGRYVPTPVHLDVNPGLSESEIKDAAAADLGGDAKQLAFRSKLVIYAGSRSTPKLAYQIYVESNLFEAWEYMIDAHTGAVLQKTPAIQTRGIPENPSQGGILLK